MTHEIACPGHALIGMKMLYGDREGDIIIPRNARSRATIGRMGLVVAVTVYPVDELSWVYDRGVPKAKKAWLNNEMYANLHMKYVACHNATYLYGQLYDVRLEHIDGIVPEEAIPSPSELGRCLTCKSPGAGNVLLGPDGYCPSCGFNLYREHKSLEQFKASESDLDWLVRQPAELNHLRRTGGKRKSTRMISFPGAKGKEFEQDAARDDEMDDIMRGLK